MAMCTLSLPACTGLHASISRSGSRVACSVPMAAALPRRTLQQRQSRRGTTAWAGRGRRDADSDSEEEEDEEEEEEGVIVEVEEYYDANDDNNNIPDTSMRLYLDSANIQEWERWAEAGLFYGFTTNPTILKRDGVACNIASMRQLMQEAERLEVEELQLQAWGTTAEEMFSCGLDLMDLEPNRIVVKLPITLEGAKAAHKLIRDGVPVTMTGVYARHQVVTAMAIGAAYCAPYVGRMTDAGKNGMDEAARMQKIVDLGSEEGHMRLLVASIRSADEVAALAQEGCNTFTISPAVAAELFNEPLTIEAAQVFQQHADAMGAMRGH